jgi:hypothetical protein
MATKEYQFWGQYPVPAGDIYAAHMDGVYIDGVLFENNVQVTDGTVHIVVAPQSADFIDKYLRVGLPTYENGEVIRVGHKFSWSPNSLATQSYDIDYAGHPYGIGLNTIAVEIELFPLPLDHNIWFNVLWAFIMEVS